MKKLITGIITAALLAGSVGVVEARDRDRGRDHDRGDRHERDYRDGRGDRDRGDYRDGRGDRDRGDYRGARHRDRSHYRNWARGSRFLWNNRDYRYAYVDNYSYYNLRRPPRGHRWVRSDGDFLLIALTTGIILDVLRYDRYDNDYYYYGDGRYYDRY